jgi:ribosomal protein L44E
MAIDKYSINYITVYDDCFSLDKNRIKAFCSGIKNLMRVKEKDIKWFCQVMVSTVDRDILSQLKDAGCTTVSYGFESFSPLVLKSMQKAIKPEQIDFAFHETLRHEMNVAATFIFGDIAETNETANETLNWWTKNADGQVRLTFVMPYPGSKIYDLCVRKGLIKNELLFVKEQLGEYLNITNVMSDNDIAELEKRIGRLSIKYGNYTVPSKYKMTSLNNFDLRVKCPFCHKQIEYKNLHDKGAHALGIGLTFNFEVNCRNCYRTFHVVNPTEKAIILGSYVFPQLGFYLKNVMTTIMKTVNRVRPQHH